jgi:type I restriction enzyme S subunit
MTNFSGNLSPQQKVNVACKGPRGGGMDRRRNQVTNQTIPEGFKQTEIGVVPEDWDVVFINDVSTLIGDGIHSTPIYDPNGAYYFINGNNIDNGSLRFTENTNRVSEAEFNKHKKKINDRTLLLSINGTIGNLCFYNNEPIILGKSAAYININHKAEVRYMYQAISFDATQQRFEDGLTGSTIKNLGLGTIKSTLIGLPSKKEQTAIANALSDMDALLSELEKLIAKKQAMKNATMQQLLTGKTRLPQFAFYSDINSAEGAVEGKRKHSSATNVNAGACDDGSLASQESGGTGIRRKGTKTSELGEIPEDWVVLTIEECSIKVGSGKTPTGGSSVYVDSGRPFVRSQNIGWGELRLTDLSFITEETHNTFQGSEIKFYDVLLNITGASIGRCALATKRIVNGNVNQHVCIIRPINKKANPYILQTLINSDSGQNQIDSYQAGGNREGLNFSQVKSMRFPFSTNPEEQTAIATILSDMDNEIQALEQRLSKTRQIKQGMMQELLTGKTRLPLDTN